MWKPLGMALVLAAVQAVVGPVLGAGFKGVYVGQDSTELPAALRGDMRQGLREGNLDGSWVRVSLSDGKVGSFSVIYSGSFLLGIRTVPVNQDVTLASAFKLHSLQPGLVPPQLGYALDRNGK